jgi:hypothetical protein
MGDLVQRRFLLRSLKNYANLGFSFTPSDFEDRFNWNVTSMIIDGFNHSHRGGSIFFLIFGWTVLILGLLSLRGARWRM